MGTRSITTFIKGDDKLVSVYRQFDGYPSGHGNELLGFLKSGKLINNGIGCMAAQFIKEFKSDVGGIYIYPLHTPSQDDWIDYTYHVITTSDPDDLDFRVKVFSGEDEVFYGSLEDYEQFINDEVKGEG